MSKPKPLSPTQAEILRILKECDGTLKGDFIWDKEGIKTTKHVREATVERLITLELIQLDGNDRGLFLYKKAA